MWHTFAVKASSIINPLTDTQGASDNDCLVSVCEYCDELAGFVTLNFL